MQRELKEEKNSKVQSKLKMKMNINDSKGGKWVTMLEKSHEIVNIQKERCVSLIQICNYHCRKHFMCVFICINYRMTNLEK